MRADPGLLRWCGFFRLRLTGMLGRFQLLLSYISIVAER